MKTIPSMTIMTGRSEMKFTYGTKQDERECVALVCDRGLLAIKGDEGQCIMLNCDSNKVYNGVSEFDVWMRQCNPRRKFYPGDKITIEF